MSASSLQSRLARAEAEVQELKHQIEQGGDWEPRPRHSYPDWERIDAFTRLHALALSIWTQAQADGEPGGDDRAACYEAVMNLLGPGVWAALDALEKERPE